MSKCVRCGDPMEPLRSVLSLLLPVCPDCVEKLLRAYHGKGHCVLGHKCDQSLSGTCDMYEATLR